MGTTNGPMPRCLHVIPGLAPRYGGPSRAILEICRALLECGIKTRIVTTDADGPGRLPVPLETVVEHEGVETIFFPRQFSEAFKYSRPLARWLCSNALTYDLVHIHAVFSHASLAAASASRRAGVPYVVRPLGSLAPWALAYKPWRKWVFWRLGARSMLQHAAAIHCTSEAEERQVCKLIGPSKTVVIPLGVQLLQASNGNPGSDAAVLDAWCPYILAMGRLHPVKGLDLLIRSFLRTVRRQERADWRLVIGGDGDPRYRDELTHLANEQGGKGRVIFPGWLQGQTKEAALQRAALVAVPSHQESFGLTVFEAISRGVPVAVSRNIDAAEAIHDAAAGWVFDLDEQSLAVALSEAMASGEERIRRGQRGRKLVESRFTWPTVAAQLQEFYCDVCGRS